MGVQEIVGEGLRETILAETKSTSDAIAFASESAGLSSLFDEHDSVNGFLDGLEKCWRLFDFIESNSEELKGKRIVSENTLNKSYVRFIYNNLDEADRLAMLDDIDGASRLKWCAKTVKDYLPDLALVLYESIAKVRRLKFDVDAVVSANMLSTRTESGVDRKSDFKPDKLNNDKKEENEVSEVEDGG